MTDPIVTLEVIAVFENTQQVGLTARIGKAAPESAEAAAAWVCPVELAPVYHEAMNVKGVDSFHATWLACSLVLKLLGHLRTEGVALRLRDGSEFPLDAYVAGLDGNGGDAPGG
jgi:hypothetical protein